MTVLKPILKYRCDLLIGLAIFLSTFSIYSSLSVQLWKAAHQPFQHFDVLFEMDTPRVIDDMADSLARHSRTTVHPLYVLFVNPASRILSSFSETESCCAIAVVLNSLFGAGGVTLAFFLFRRMSGNLINALLLSMIFAFSMSQLFLSMVPDTASLAVISLLVTYGLFWGSLYYKEVPMAVWIFAGVFSMGVTITNVMQTLICFSIAKLFAAMRPRNSASSVKGVFRQVIFFGCGVLLVSVLLALVQKAVYPSTKLFFVSSEFSKEIGYMTIRIFRQPLNMITQLFKHFFVVNVAGVSPYVFDVGEEVPAITFSKAWNYSLYAFLTFAAWIFLVGAGVYYQKYRGRGWFYAGLAGCLASNLILHTVYGAGISGEMEYFLYTGNFTALLLIMFLEPVLEMKNRFVRPLLILLLFSLAANNLIVIHDIISLYNGV